MALLANALENSVCSPHDASGGDALRIVGYERLGRVAARLVGTVGAVGGGGAPKVAKVAQLIVHQVQADYWYWDVPEIKAGSGFLRILTFRPDENSIDVQTYSPVTDTFLTRPKSAFSLDYQMQSDKN